MNKIKPNELYKYIGQRVNAEQLDDILDTYIILTDIRKVRNKIGVCNIEGTIDEFSKEPIRLTKNNSTIVYNDSFEAEDFCGYE